MIDLLGDVAALIGAWLVASVGAFAIHLLTGCLSEGVDEVARQTRVAYREAGPTGFAVMILTAGIVAPEPEVDL